MLLSSAFDAENYETGELPELFGSQAQTGEFFFTIVQSELFAPGDLMGNVNLQGNANSPGNAKQ